MKIPDCDLFDAEGKPWTTTASGRAFPVGDPRPEDFRIADIAHHLSRLNRYTGAICTEHYSVAEHSVRVAYYLRALVARELATRDPHVLSAAFRAGLMHDAHEAYLNDLNSPLKRYLLSIGERGYHDLAERYDAILGQRYDLWRFGPPHTGIDLIHEADVSLLDLERPQVMGPPPRQHLPLGVLPKVPFPDDWVWPFHDDPVFGRWGWAPNVARAVFLRAAANTGLED